MPRRKKELLDLLKRKKQVARSPRPPTVHPAPVPSQGSRKKSAPPLLERLKGHPLFGWLPAAVALVLSVLVLDWLLGDCQGPLRNSATPEVSAPGSGAGPSPSFSIMAATYAASDRELAGRTAAALKEILDPDGDGFPPVQLLQPLKYPDILEVYVGSAPSVEGLQQLLSHVVRISVPSEPSSHPFSSAYIRASHQID